MATWINFADIRARVSLEDVLLRFYGIDTLRRTGTKLVGPCPVHGGDNTRAFHADTSKNVWHCFTRCGRGGNALDLVAAKEGIGVRDAALKLQAFLDGRVAGEVPHQEAQVSRAPARATVPAPAGAPRREPRPAPAPAAPRPAPTPPRASVAPARNPPLSVSLTLRPHPHLSERGLSDETIQTFGLGYATSGIMRGTIAIPIHDEDGTLVAFAGRRLKPADIMDHGKYKLPKGFRKELVLFNYHRAKAHAEGLGLILVEGFFSTMLLTERGFPNTVAGLGIEVSDHQVELLARASSVTVLFDGDEAGRQGAKSAREKLAPRVETHLVELPEGMEPEDLPVRALRWALNGVKALKLERLAFRFLPPPTA